MSYTYDRSATAHLVLKQFGPGSWTTEDNRWNIERLRMKGGDVFRLSDLYGKRTWERDTFAAAVSELEKLTKSKVRTESHPWTTSK